MNKLIFILTCLFLLSCGIDMGLDDSCPECSSRDCYAACKSHDDCDSRDVKLTRKIHYASMIYFIRLYLENELYKNAAIVQFKERLQIQKNDNTKSTLTSQGYEVITSKQASTKCYSLPRYIYKSNHQTVNYDSKITLPLDSNNFVHFELKDANSVVKKFDIDLTPYKTFYKQIGDSIQITFPSKQAYFIATLNDSEFRVNADTATTPTIVGLDSLSKSHIYLFDSFGMNTVVGRDSFTVRVDINLKPENGIE